MINQQIQQFIIEGQQQQFCYCGYGFILPKNLSRNKEYAKSMIKS